MATLMNDIASARLNIQEGQIFSKTLSLTAAGYSDPVLVPMKKIYTLLASVSGAGTGALQFTQDSEAMMDAGTAVWTDWDGTAEISHGVTGFRLKSTSGAVTGKVTIKAFV